jgi:sortase A
LGIRARHGSQDSTRSPKSWRVRALTVLSVTAVVAGLAIGANIGWFYWHTHTAGGNLLHKERAEIAAARAGPPASHSSEFDQPSSAHVRSASSVTQARSAALPPTCQNSTKNTTVTTGQPQGIVEAQDIGMDAPVVQGVGDQQLAVAVGHVPTSVWPGPGGTVVFSAHDVSWFSDIDHLKPGSTVRYVTPCRTFVYRVTSHAIVMAGSPVANTVRPSLVLDTCYPLDALWITSKRYLVYADLVQVQGGGHTTELPAATDGTVPTSLPAPLASEVAARLTTSAPLGPLVITGTPTAAWRQSIKPLNGSGSALTLYFGALELASKGDSFGWAQTAPGLGPGPIGPLWNAEVDSTVNPVAPTLAVKGSSLTAAGVTSTVHVSGGNSPGTYHITMGAAMEHGHLTVTGWQMTPA